MTNQELKEIDKEMMSKLPNDIYKMFLKKNVNVSVMKVTSKDGFLNIEILVDIPNTTRLARVFLELDRSALYNPKHCALLDARGGMNPNTLKLIDLIELRVLRVAFEVVKTLYKGATNAVGQTVIFNGNTLMVSFASNRGNLAY